MVKIDAAPNYKRWKNTNPKRDGDGPLPYPSLGNTEILCSEVLSKRNQVYPEKSFGSTTMVGLFRTSCCKCRCRCNKEVAK